MLSLNDQKVFGWYADFDGCGFYRIVQPLDALDDDILDEQIWLPKYDRFLPANWPDFDVIVGQRICQAADANGPAEVWANQIAQDRDVLSVYEIDDDLLNLDPSNPAYGFFADPAIRNNLKACIQVSDLVTVSTPALREQMLQYNPNVKVIPNFIDTDVLDIDRPDSRLRGDKVVLGWCGSRTHQADFEVIGDELAVVMGMHQNTIFHTIGANYIRGVPPARVFKEGWVRSPRRIYERIANFDIGIAPLKKSIFNESKSYIKVLEYAALGIPCVASAVGPYPDFVEHGVTGFLASKPGDWKEYLTLLINDKYLRLEMGENARAKADDYTIQGNAWRYATAYRA